MRTTALDSTQLKNLYNALSPDARSAIDDRALDWALIEHTQMNIDRLEKGLPIERHYGSWVVGWSQIEKALQEALEQAGRRAPVQPRCGGHRPHQRPEPKSFPRAEAYAKFLYDQGALGTPSLQRPAGDFREVMIRRGSLVDGEDFGILVSKDPLQTPIGPANQFYVFTKLAEMAGPTPTKYFGPFDDSILPNE
jgi:hypothetical protein